MTAIWDFVTGIFGTLTSLLSLLTPLFILVSGIVSLFFGRKLFWVFVAAVGFLLGLYLADWLTPMLPEQVAPWAEFVRLGLALGAAGLALIVQRAGTILAGAFAVGLLGWWGAGELEISGWAQMTTAVVSGLLGAVLLYFALDWALLVITTLAGGLIAVSGMEALQGVPRDSGPWLYIVLVVAGLLYQRRELVQDSGARAAVPAPEVAPKVEKAPKAEKAPKPQKAPKPARSPKGIKTTAPAPEFVAAETAPVAPAFVVTPLPGSTTPAPATTETDPAPVERRRIALKMPTFRNPLAGVSLKQQAAKLNPARWSLFQRRAKAPQAGAPLPESELQPLEPLGGNGALASYAPPSFAPSFPSSSLPTSSPAIPAAPRGSVPPPVGHIVYG